jgi:hypothetical protein
MAIRSRINQYLGINAHYQSVAQAEIKGWKPFHSVYIVDLMRDIQHRLPPGYRVEPEDSLQIILQEPETGMERTHYPVADATIWKTPPSIDRSSLSPHPRTAVAIPVKTQAIADTLEDAEEWGALVISEVRADGKAVPVTRLEVFSPTSKAAEGYGRQAYLKGRSITLRAGISLVEIGFLHETDSPVKGILPYRGQSPDAYPYTITVNDARSGQTNTYGFVVDEPLLPIEVPLSGAASVAVNFGDSYHTSFNNTLAFADRVNYVKEPPHVERYRPADRHRIWARMLAVIDAARAGQDLERGPLPALSDDPTLGALLEPPYYAACLLVDEESLDVYWLVHRKEARQDELSLVRRPANRMTDTLQVSAEALQTGDPSAVANFYHALKAIFDEQGWEAFRAALPQRRL